MILPVQILLVKPLDLIYKNICFFIIGKEGSLTQILLNLIIEDMKSGPPTVRAPIPY